MNKSSTSAGNAAQGQPGWLVLLGILVIALASLFHRSFIGNQVLFSNDGPLGIISSQCVRTTPSTFVAAWQDLNWLGNEGITPDASLSSLMAMVLQPLYYAKFASPIGLLVLGLCAWVFFRQLRLAPWACVIGAVATTFNSDFFSTSVWGIVVQPIAIGACFLSLAAMARVGEGSAMRGWVRVALAGFAVGMAVVQGADVGALFSLFVAAYVFYQAIFLNERAKGPGQEVGQGFARLMLVAICALFIATHTLISLVGTQIQGIAGAGQTAEQRQAYWAFATEWSQPKIEILQAVIPGIFGYRQIWHMYDTYQPKEDQYWGTIGQDPRNPANLPRLSGTGLYAGIFVLIVALWAVFKSMRGDGYPFSKMQRRAIWFWTAMLVATALLGFGKYAPFYQFFFDLPHMASIRNPTKFFHIFSWVLVILFAYGVHGLVTVYMQDGSERANGVVAGFRKWWGAGPTFDRSWLSGCVFMIGLSIVGAFIYGAYNGRLQDYLANDYISQDQIAAVAKFSLHSVYWFILFLVLATVLLALIFSGAFSGRAAAWGGGLIVLLLVVDLGRADAPWIVYWNTDYKYASDPVTKFLADKPYEHRVSFLQLNQFGSSPSGRAFIQEVLSKDPQYALMQQAYFSQWKQHIWPYNNIQCAESIQEPRVGTDKAEFEQAMASSSAGTLRIWELLNTSYIVGDDTILEKLNGQSGKLFQTAKFPDGTPVKFDFVPKSPELAQSSEPVDYNIVPSANGHLQVMQFMGALPRASLYANWQVSPDDYTTLATLAGANFDPHALVLVSNSIPAPKLTDAVKDPGTVEINPNYQPKRVELEADVKVPAVLLLCDRYNPKWTVTVDDKPAELLRCNFIERGVMLQPGPHKVVFQFTGSFATIAVSFTAVLIALGLCGWLAITETPDAAVVDNAKPRGSEKSTQPQPVGAGPARTGDNKKGPDPRKNKGRKS